MSEAGDAARAVAAEVGFGAVGVVEAHAEVGGGGGGGLEEDEAVGADAAAAVAQVADVGGVGGGEGEGAVVDEDEVVAGAMHFPEGLGHGAGGRVR